jgi:AraC-like DNA-binding protein
MRWQKSPDKNRGAPEFFSADVGRARRFYLDLKPAPEARLVVLCGGLEHCTPDYAIHRTTFPFHSIEYVADGRGEVSLNGHAYPLQPGRLFSYGPGVSQHITGDAAEPLVKYFVDFAGSDAARLLKQCGLASGGVSQVHPPNVLQALFGELIEDGLRMSHQERGLCGKLLECLMLKISDTRVLVEAGDTLALSTYQRCRQHIDRHFARLCTLEQLASECNVNNAYLCRLFQRYDHQSPYQYLLRLKMNLAAERLQQPGSLVKQAAEEIGFSDPFHFSRVFKSFLGVSPGAFRRMRYGEFIATLEPPSAPQPEAVHEANRSYCRRAPDSQSDSIRLVRECLS